MISKLSNNQAHYRTSHMTYNHMNQQLTHFSFFSITSSIGHVTMVTGLYKYC